MNRLRGFMQSYHPIVQSLFVGTVLARAASTMSMPFLAIYLAHRTGLSPASIGLIAGSSSLAGTFAGFFGGSLSDRFGRKKVMMGALYTWSLVFILFALVSSPWLFLILNLLNGVCRSFFEPVSQALMGDLTPPEKRLRMFSARYMAINIGVSVGPMTGALLGLAAGPAPFLVTGIVYLIYAVTLGYLLNRFGIAQIESQQKKEHITIRASLKVLVKDTALQFFLLGGIFGAISYSQETINLGQYLEKSFANGIALFAFLQSLNAIVVVVAQIPISRWSEKRTPFQSILIGNIFFAIGDVGFGFANGPVTMSLAMIVFTIGEVLVFPASSVFIDRLAPEDLRGTYFGSQNFKNIGQFIGPWLGGLLMTSYGARSMFIIVAVLMFVGGTWSFNIGEKLTDARMKERQRRQKVIA